MKKKIKFRLKNDLALAFWISVSICLVCALFCYALFHNNFFKALVKLDEEPIATITFKYRTAERKFLDRVIWDRLRQNSPVYNGDTIHTAALSEATIYFKDGTTLELSENTMAQVFLHEDGIHGADLASGSASLASGEETKGFSFSSANVQLSVKAGSKLSAQKVEEGSVNLSVQKGDALLTSGQKVSEGSAVTVVDGVAEEALFSIVSPLQNEKFLYYSKELNAVTFEWNAREDVKDFFLEIASDKRYKNIVKTVNISGENKVLVELASGIYYWKLLCLDSKDGSKKEVENSFGKFQIIQSLKPELVIPADNYTYTYRKQNPSVRFIWTESEAATAYNFAVSKNPDMSEPLIEERSSSSSIIISTLSAGTYYYQITPYYVLNHTGLKNPSRTGKFIIEQRDELKAPLLVSPEDGGFVDKTKDKTLLSWHMEKESVTYNVSVSRKKDLSSPVILRQTKENYISLTSSDIKALSDGNYYWAVSQTDSEGNKSEVSEVRTFYAINGEIEQRTVFPPNDYVLWKPLLSDLRFTWKTNLNLSQYFQIAKDEDFKNIIIDCESNSNSYSGAELSTGQYYWRITTKDQSFLRTSPAKKLTVVSELEPVKINYPNYSQRALVKPDSLSEFSWQEVEGADYYRVRILKSDSDEVLFDQNFVTGNKFEIDLEDFEETNYRWDIQSYCYETEKSSRRSSVLSQTDFFIRKLRPSRLLSPKDGVRIGGWQAIENPPVLKWASYEDFSKANLVLVKKTGLNAGETLYIQKNYQQALPSLNAGEYEWYVNVYTTDGYDISSDKRFSFTVEEIPPFEAPSGVKTLGGDYFDTAYLKKTPYIMFSWKSLEHAETYVLEIYGKNNSVIYSTFINGNKNTEFMLEDLSMLSKGVFSWGVKAVLLDKDKKRILVDGKVSKNKFTIDYSINKNGAKRKLKGDLYAE